MTAERSCTSASGPDVGSTGADDGGGNAEKVAATGAGARDRSSTSAVSGGGSSDRDFADCLSRQSYSSSSRHVSQVHRRDVPSRFNSLHSSHEKCS